MLKTRWICSIGLLAILSLGLFLRLHGLTRYSIWRDESWVVYLATGRGDLLFNIPFQKVVTDPPNVGFEGAPGWWHIWNSLDGVAHPPGYYVGLRWWIDLFGQSDGSIRSMSLIFGLVGIVVLFDCVRMLAGPWRGLAAAGIMAMAPMQLDFSQQARPYTLATLVGLLIYDLLIRIEKRGSSRWKLAGLSIFVTLAMLIHYFVMGFVAGAAIYAILRFKNPVRRRVLVSMAISVAIVAVIWGPFVPQSRGAFHNDLGISESRTKLLLSTIDAPQRLLFNEAAHTNWFISGALAVLVYLLPLLDRRKLVWWLWVVLSLMCVLCVDLMKHTVVMQIDRYIFLAGAGVFALVAMPLATRIGWLVPVVVLAGVAVAAVQWYQSGPSYSMGSVYIWEEDRLSARFLKDRVQQGDVVIITDNLVTYAEFTYLATAHYNGQWRVPIVLLREPMDERLKAEVFKYNRVWVIGQFPSTDTMRLLPGCRAMDVGGTVAFDSVWRVK